MGRCWRGELKVVVEKGALVLAYFTTGGSRSHSRRADSGGCNRYSLSPVLRERVGVRVLGEDSASRSKTSPHPNPLPEYREREQSDNAAMFNGTPGDPHSFDALDELLNQQSYRLAYWRTASDEINYRRFFDINDLAALRQENDEVFQATHALTLRLAAEGKVAGLRIDHPDGLFEPEQYFQTLQREFVLGCVRRACDTDPRFEPADWDTAAVGLRERIDRALRQRNGGPMPLYVVAEKILAADEQLRGRLANLWHQRLRLH